MKRPIDDTTPLARIAALRTSPQGIVPVKLDGSLSATGTATGSILFWSHTDSEWQDSGTNIEGLRGLGLNTGETYAAGTKGLAVWCTFTWIFVPLSCDPDDTGI